MTQHLEIIALMALAAWGAHVAMREGMIAAPLRRVLERLPALLHKPLFDCPVCMCSAWGIPTAIYIAPERWSFLPVYLLASAGLAYVIAQRE